MMSRHPNRYVIIRGQCVMDDQFRMEWTGPIGPAKVKCPDCEQELTIEGIGDLSCGGCRSQYAVSGDTPLSGRRQYSIRRKVVSQTWGETGPA